MNNNIGNMSLNDVYLVCARHHVGAFICTVLLGVDNSLYDGQALSLSPFLSKGNEGLWLEVPRISRAKLGFVDELSVKQW